MWFTSDNASAAAPEILAALAAANTGFEHSYGADAAMARVTARIRAIFEAPEAAVYLVATGTAANALGLACLCPPWATVHCHQDAHIQVDECAAPEFYSGGAKLAPLPGAQGRIDPDALRAALDTATGVHNAQHGALSLTNATEAGTVYGVDQVQTLTALARAHRLPVHMDGARFTNALVGLGCSPADLTWRAGVDVLSFGGTKNGCLGVEAVILFDPARAWEFELRRKRGGHLFSKHRYLSAQMEAYLTDDLWLRLARAANARAAQLSAGITALPGAVLTHPTEANAVFASFPRAAHRRARAAGAEYHFWPSDHSLDGPDDMLLPARLVCGWSTTQAEVTAFLDLLT